MIFIDAVSRLKFPMMWGANPFFNPPAPHCTTATSKCFNFNAWLMAIFRKLFKRYPLWMNEWSKSLFLRFFPRNLARAGIIMLRYSIEFCPIQKVDFRYLPWKSGFLWWYFSLFFNFFRLLYFSTCPPKTKWNVLKIWNKISLFDCTSYHTANFKIRTLECNQLCLYRDVVSQ